MPINNDSLRKYNETFEQIDIKNDWVRFYNHGYGGKSLLDYDKKDLKFKNRANLYAHLFERVDVKDKDLIDIGCGLGRGCNLLKKHYPLKSITGIDININHVMFAKKNFKGIEFLQCDAESLDTLKKRKLKLIMDINQIFKICTGLSKPFLLELKDDNDRRYKDYLINPIYEVRV